MHGGYLVGSGFLCSDIYSTVYLSYHYPAINMLSSQTWCVIVSRYPDVSHDMNYISESSLFPHGYIEWHKTPPTLYSAECK